MKGDPSRTAESDPFKRFGAALRKIVSVSKEELLKREAAYKRERERMKGKGVKRK